MDGTEEPGDTGGGGPDGTGDVGDVDVAGLASDLRAAARWTDQRRLLVLAGERAAGTRGACAALAGAGLPADGTTVLADGPTAGTVRRAAAAAGLDADALDVRPTARADRLLGTTRDAVVLDLHDACRPNALGRVAGVVDGGGLLVLLTPPLDAWPERRDGFDEGLAVPPYGVDDVTGHFRRRLVRTLRAHPGVAVVDVDAGTVERDGTLEEPPRYRSSPVVPRDPAFPAAAYEACLTGDQSRALAALESLREPDAAVVVEADRGRGKSSAAGLAAGALAADGRDVLVTAPGAESARAVFVRAAALLADLGDLDRDEGADHLVEATSGGRVRFAPSSEAATLPGDPDVVVVDEAAALPVRVLEGLLDAPAAGFVTTVHGYEGAGRGFSVRFRERLDASGKAVDEIHIDEPIRYARGDPVESWAFRALLLDARPPVDQVVADATPWTVEYAALDPADLAADEHRLREVFGLLVVAHYRTEPDDLARLLDAPNLRIRALIHDGHVVSVALLAREGDLPADTRRAMYEGSRVRGNMLPDVLTSQLRDESAGVPAGYRVMRIATHHAVRSRGLGSRLLSKVDDDPTLADADWFGVGYGATPELLRFWARNGYRTVHLSTTRNEASGEYSAVMLRPTSDAGRALGDRHAAWFLDRVGGVLADPLDDLDPDVARAALRATGPAVDPGLDERAWRVVVGAAYGPGLYTTAPDAFRRLALAHLTGAESTESTGTDPDGAALASLEAREERLLVRKVLQARPWDEVADELGYVSTSECMRALGEAFQPLVDVYGGEVAAEERRRYVD